jgi:MarR family transcriptional regulator, lower aerobic nicotinate degradation pathway regulator
VAPKLSTVDSLAQLSFTVLGLLERRVDEHDASIIQTRLLGILRDRTPTMNELGRLLALDKSSVTGLVDRAERRQLVKRVPSTADRRSVQVVLTTAGRSLVTEVADAFEQDITALLDCLSTAEREQLSELASRVLVEQAGRRGLDLLATGPVPDDR